jgi:hypothetical protein
MPIRINLLAEAQAAEELRRKDPVKRVILASGLLVCGVLVWSSTLQVKIVSARGNLKTFETQWKAQEKDYSNAVDKSKQAAETDEKLGSLTAYTTNRFLWGTLLDGFQETMTGVDNLQVVRLRSEQTFTLTEEVKPKSNGNVVASGKPATSTEKVLLTIEALDSSPQAGGNVKRFKEAITSVNYFQSHLQKTNGVLLTTLSPQQTGPLNAKPYVTFTFQCYFPEKTR